MTKVEPAQSVPHPFIPDWSGERSWTAPGEPLSDFITFQTDGDIEPFRISHDRDMMFDGGALVQDYNFIDYFFGDPKHPICGRHYIGDSHVSISFAGSVPLEATPQSAASHVPHEVLRYFRRRFPSVSILTAEGYLELSA
jgi:hypothetical protein